MHRKFNSGCRGRVYYRPARRVTVMPIALPTKFTRSIRRIPPAGFHTMSPQNPQGRPSWRPQGLNIQPMMNGNNIIPKAANAVKSKMKNLSARDMIYLVKFFL